MSWLDKLKSWDWIKKNVLRIEVLGPAIVIFLAIVFFLTKKSGKYDFEGIEGEDVEFSKGKGGKKKKKGKKVWKHEEKCRQILEKIFNKKFPSCRPDFLKNPTTGKNLEIDCYNEELKLGLEYNGVQHSKYTKNFHKHGVKEFEYQVAKDRWKAKKCKTQGIDLIQIPHFVVESDLESYILDQLKRLKRLPRRIL